MANQLQYSTTDQSAETSEKFKKFKKSTMRGILVFNDNHELLYLKSDKSLRSYLKKRQSDMQYSMTNTIVDESLPSNSSVKAFDGCDPITIAYIFLPLIVCYESMKCIKFDRFLSIRNENVCFYFTESNDDNRLIILAIGDGNAKNEDMNFLLSNFVSALAFAFGPLSCSMSHPSMVGQLDLLNFMLKLERGAHESEDFFNLDSISNEKTFMQTILQHVDVCGLIKEDLAMEQGQKSPLMSALSCIGGQFHAFLKCQLCFLVRNGVILGIFSRYSANQQSSGKEGKGKSKEINTMEYRQQIMAKAWQVISLLRTNTRFGCSNSGHKHHTEPTCYYCYTVSLHPGPSTITSSPGSALADVFSDVFRIDLSDDVQLICITPVTHGDLMTDLTQTMAMIETLDLLRFEHALLASNPQTLPRAKKILSYYDFWLGKLNLYAGSLCDRLDDRLIFMDGAKSRRLASTFQGLYRNLRELTEWKGHQRPDVTRYEGEETSTLKSLRQLAGALLLDTFSAATQEAKRYKLEKLDRCWRNLTSSDLYASTIVTLMEQSVSDFAVFDEGPRASRFTLDATAYVFLLPEKRFLVTNGVNFSGQFQETKIWRIMHEMVTGLKTRQKPGSINVKVVCPEEKRGHLMIFLSLKKEEKDRRGTTSNFFSKFLSSTSSHRVTADEGESALRHYVKESVVIMCAFEPFVHEDLAWRETRLLAIHLYEMVMGVKWVFG